MLISFVPPPPPPKKKNLGLFMFLGPCLLTGVIAEADLQTCTSSLNRFQIESMSENDPKLSFHTIEIGTFTGQISEGTKFSIWEIYKLSKCAIPVNVFIDNLVLMTKLGSFLIFKWRKERKWNRKHAFLHPVNSTLKKVEFVRHYLIPFGKAMAILTALACGVLLLHFCYVMSGWIWEQLTVKVIIFIYVTIMILFLALFRP